MFKNYVKSVTESVWFDVLGVVIILTAVFSMGYYKTPLSASSFFQGQHGILYTLPLIGIVSTLSSIASVMSTRLVAKVNNFGNVIGWINTIFSGVIDFLLGNAGAWLTYPVSIILNWLASKNWNKKGDKMGTVKNFTLILIVLIVSSFIVGFGLNAIAYSLVHWNFDVIYYFASLTFSLSLIANVLNVLKLPSQWSFWAIYNVAQLGKAISQMNIANVAKYIYYIINSILAGVYWILSKNSRN